MKTGYSASILLTVRSVILCTLLLSALPVNAESKNGSPDFALLERQTQSIFRQYLESLPEEALQDPESGSRFQQVRSMQFPADPLAELQFLNDARHAILNNQQRADLAAIIETMARLNQLWMLGSLAEHFTRLGDADLTAIIELHHAVYHAGHRHWNQVQQHLDKAEGLLYGEDADRALLLRGMALQHRIEHRQAIGLYTQIPSESSYWVHANINLAIGLIRQGWVTEARQQVLKVIDSGQFMEQPQLRNRLWLILGYALLKWEYFRDAVEAFTRVEEDSRYYNRGLLATALAQTSNGKFGQALATLAQLSQRGQEDLSSYEAQLLIPLLHDRLGHQQKIESSYNNAIDFFLLKIGQLNLRADELQNSTILADLDRRTLSLEPLTIELEELAPLSFFINRRLLLEMVARSSAAENNSEADRLLREHDAALRHLAAEHLTDHGRKLKSYLNQSRFGLAQFFDRQNAVGKK